MKKILALLIAGLLSSTLAKADNVELVANPIGEIQLGTGGSSGGSGGTSNSPSDAEIQSVINTMIEAHQVNFGINKKLGRAWVEVNKKNSINYNRQDLSGKWLVKGLSYDDGSKSVIYNNAVVATLNLKKGIFGSTYESIDLVTNVNLILSIEKKAIDNGFNINHTNFEIIKLELNK